MYIYLTEDVLSRSDLTGDEKILLSYIRILDKQNRAFFGSEGWTRDNLGITGVNKVLKSLIEGGFIVGQNGSYKFKGLNDVKEKEKSNDLIKLKSTIVVQDEVNSWLEKGFDIVDENADAVILSNRMETMRVYKYERV